MFLRASLRAGLFSVQRFNSSFIRESRDLTGMRNTARTVKAQSITESPPRTARQRLERILGADRRALIETNERARAGLKPKRIQRFIN